MKWINVKPDISACNVDSITQGWSAIDIVHLINETVDTPIIILPEQVRMKIMHHLRSRRVELGGLLIGSVFSIDDLESGIVLISIKDAIASHDFNSTAVSLSMSSSVWQHANQNSDSKTFVVGWYHSHPNLGAYFSSTDRKTQKDFFKAPYNFGLVIDPFREEEKWFMGENSDPISSGYIKNDLYGLKKHNNPDYS